MHRIRDTKLGDDVKGLMETVKKRYKDKSRGRSATIYRQRSLKRKQRFDALAQAGTTLTVIPESMEDAQEKMQRTSFSDSDDSKSTQSSVVSWTPTPTNVRKLLKSRARSPHRQDEGDTSTRMEVEEWRKSIETAIITDNANYLQDLLKGFDIKNDDGFSFLHLAVLHKNEACARKLIRSGWNVNAVDDISRTPLHYAATQDNPNVVSLLLKNGAKLSLFDSQGMSPCMYAAHAGRDENLREMIEGAKRSDIHMSNKEGKTALHFAAVQEEPDCIKHLARYSTPIDLSVQDNNYETPLHLAALGKHTRNVECLLEAGANPYAMAVDMLTPLHYSAFLWDTRTIKVFLDNQDLDINAKTKNGKTVLHLATMINPANANGIFSQADCVQFLLQCDGINVNLLDDTKSPPLGYAVEHDYIISKLLIEAGASVNTCEKKTQNNSKVIAMPPLHRAVQSNRPENVALLLENNALVNIKSLYGKTALHVAMEEENEKCVDVLLQYGADPNLADEEGRRPLEVAIEQNNHDLICSILRHSVSEVPCIWTGGESTFKVTLGSFFSNSDEPETNLLKKINESFSEEHKEEIFTLPATRAFIELKEKMLKKLELIWIVITLLYIGFSLQFLLRYLNCIFEKNSQKVVRDNLHSSDIPNACTAPGSIPFIAWIIWAAFLPFYLVLRVLEISANFPHNINRLDVFLDLLMCCSAIVLCPWSFLSLQTQKIISVVAAIACGMTLFLYLGNLLSFCRLYVLIFRRVLAAVACISLVFFPLLLCFGFTFNLIFQHNSETKDSFERFSLFLIYVAGNLQGTSDYNGPPGNKLTLAILTAVFLLLIVIVMMNLFTGVSVLITSTLEKHSLYKVTHARFLIIHSRERLLGLLGKLRYYSLEACLMPSLSIKVSEHPFRHLGCVARFRYNVLFNFGCLHAREVWPMSSVGFSKTDIHSIKAANRKKGMKQSSETKSSLTLCDSESYTCYNTIPIYHPSKEGEFKMIEQRINQMQKNMNGIEKLLVKVLSKQEDSS